MLDSALLQGGRSLCQNLDSALLSRAEGTYPKLGQRLTFKGRKNLS